MRRSGQVLIEALLAAVFLMVAIPKIPAVTDSVMGYDAGDYEAQVELNHKFVEWSQTRKQLRRDIELLDAEAQDRAVARRATRSRQVEEPLIAGTVIRVGN